MKTKIQKHGVALLLSVIAVVLVASVPANAQNLISYWNFDEGTGTITHDSTNANNGTLNGPSWATGKINAALSFDGTDDYVEVPDSESLKPTEGITIEAWVKPTTVVGDRTIVSKYYGDGYYIRISSGAIDFSGHGWIAGGAIPAGGWSHVAGTYNASDAMSKIYLNGALVKSGETAWPAPCPVTHMNCALRIGAWPVDATQPFAGIIDEARIYDGALSAESIAQHYEEGPSGHEMISHWTFDEGEGTIAQDSASGNHGTLYGPSWATGKVNAALSFDGTDDYVEVADSPSLKPIDAITLEAWVNPATVVGNHAIVSKYYGDGYYIRISDGVIDFCGHGWLAGGTISVGEWSHVAGTYNASDAMSKIYLNGALVTSGETAWPAPCPVTHRDCALRIGAWPNSTSQPFAGIIDEVAVYGEALSAYEIEQRYEAGGGQPPTYPPPQGSVTYTSSFDGTEYTYYVTVENTSEGPYDIYFLFFGHHCNAPSVMTFDNTSDVSSPDQWYWQLVTQNAVWATNWEGSSMLSGYICPETSLGGFAFSSSTPPPETVPFAVGFYDNIYSWGFAYNGTATYIPPESTPEGKGVQVPVDPTVLLTFSEVTEAGTTSLTTTGEGPAPPSGFMLGEPVTYYEITTTADYSGEIEIRFSYSGISFTGSPEDLKLYHYENGQWVDCTTSVDTTNQLIYGSVTSLSPFVILEPATNQPPTANAGPDQTVEATSPDGAAVTLDGSGSSDPDGDPLTYIWTWGQNGSATGVYPNIALPLGITAVTLTVSDGQLSHSDTVEITVMDKTPPTIKSIAANPNVLWPANHKMVKVTLTVQCEDICDPDPLCMVMDVTCNEAVNGPGDGNTEPDWDWEFTDDPSVVLLRAESAGTGTGRVYTIFVACIDSSKNTSEEMTVAVTVPHDQNKKKK